MWKASRSKRHRHGIAHYWGPFITGPEAQDPERRIPLCGAPWRLVKDLEEPTPAMHTCVVCQKKADEKRVNDAQRLANAMGHARELLILLNCGEIGLEDPAANALLKKLLREVQSGEVRLEGTS